jgi:membrane-associated protease RseP (regulator of RpoE activity)
MLFLIDQWIAAVSVGSLSLFYRLAVARLDGVVVRRIAVGFRPAVSSFRR